LLRLCFNLNFPDIPDVGAREVGGAMDAVLNNGIQNNFEDDSQIDGNDTPDYDDEGAFVVSITYYCN